MAENDSNNIQFILIILGGLAIAGYVWWQKNGQGIEDSFFAISWTRIGITIAIVVFSLIALIYTIRTIRNSVKEKQDQEDFLNREKGKLFKQLNKELKGNSQEIEEQYDKIKDNLKYINPNIRKQHEKEINQFYKNTKKLIKEAKKWEEQIRQERYEQEQARQRRKQREINKFWKKVEELFQYKKKVNSTKALPLNKKYSKDVIDQATTQMKRYKQDQEFVNDTKQEAIEYYKSHPLDSQPELNNEQEEIYSQVRKDIKKGKIQLKEEVKIEYQGKKLEKDFYRSVDLDEQTKLKARAQGFVHVDGSKLDGKIQGGGYYIRKENPRESKKHFYLKHLFAELHENMQLEYKKDGRRVDVALNIEGFKIGIEIETGANRTKQLAEKVIWLNKHFDQWIFVCPRKLHPKYNKFVDHKKSFCFGPKKARDFILGFIPPDDLL